MQGDAGEQTVGPGVRPLADAAALLAEAVAVEPWRLAEADLGAALERLDALRRDTERLTLALVGEAGERGTAHTQGASTLTDWVAQRSPSLAVREAHQLATVAVACRRPGHGPLVEAVGSGLLPARKAARLLRALDQVRPFVDAEDYEADQRILIPLAVSGTDKELTLATRHLVAWPSPSAEEPDTRSPGQRRCDALLTVLQRGIASADGVPATARTKVVVTVSHDQLVGALRGLGRTVTDDQLTPAALRRLACDAEILPAVMGTASAPLDLGRTTRLASPAQLLALWHRDRGCTQPGCSVPPTWCHAHHIVHWCDGGPTDLGNLALLCPRHHTMVHELGLTATVTGHGVTWHT